MPRFSCPVCGDPNAYPFWIDAEPPAGCPHDADEDGNLNWGDGGVRKVTDICQWQRDKAWQAAEFRKLVPDAFDENGTMKKGELYRVIIAFGEAHPGKPLIA